MILASTPLHFKVVSVGKALGSAVLDNVELAIKLNKDPGWIEERCGIKSRRVASSGETTIGLAISAGRSALANVPSCRPDFVICSTFTPDYQLCPCAPAVASGLNLEGIPAFDVNAACTGGLIGLLNAISLLGSGMARRILLVASDTTTRHLAPNDCHTRILFGDAAAAILLESCSNNGDRVLSWVMGSDGSGAKLFYVPRGGSAFPYSDDGLHDVKGHTVMMRGHQLFRFACQCGSDMLSAVCGKAGISPSDLDAIVIHQANARIINSLQHRTGISAEKWVLDICEVGNTGSPSVLMAYAGLFSAGVLRPGKRVLLAAFGGGLTWAAVLIECGEAVPGDGV